METSTTMVQSSSTEAPEALSGSIETAATTETPTAQRWVTPPVDLYETEDGLQLVADIPGVDPAHLEVQVHSRRLRFQAVRANGLGYRRIFRLHDEIDAAGITAEVRDGVLTLGLPRRPEHRPRQILITAG